jgi:hypothetical protein
MGQLSPRLRLSESHVCVCAVYLPVCLGVAERGDERESARSKARQKRHTDACRVEAGRSSLDAAAAAEQIWLYAVCLKVYFWSGLRSRARPEEARNNARV